MGGPLPADRRRASSGRWPPTTSVTPRWSPRCGRCCTPAPRRVVVVSSIAARGGRLTATTTRDELVDPGSPYDGKRVYEQHQAGQPAVRPGAAPPRRPGRLAGERRSRVHPGVSNTNLFARQLQEGGKRLLAPLSRAVTKVALQSATAGALPTLRGAGPQHAQRRLRRAERAGPGARPARAARGLPVRPGPGRGRAAVGADRGGPRHPAAGLAARGDAAGRPRHARRPGRRGRAGPARHRAGPRRRRRVGACSSSTGAPPAGSSSRSWPLLFVAGIVLKYALPGRRLSGAAAPQHAAAGGRRRGRRLRPAAAAGAAARRRRRHLRSRRPAALGPGARRRGRSTVQVLKAVGLGVLAELTAAVLMVATWLVGVALT